MNPTTEKVTVGCLLHDIGKILFRAETDGRSHDLSGYEFLARIRPDDIIGQCVRFHHKRDLSGASIPPSSPAYITYIADNIAAGADRRRGEDNAAAVFRKDLPLSSIFNPVNGEPEGKAVPFDLSGEEIPLPSADAKPLDPGTYRLLAEEIKTALFAVDFGGPYVNSVLQIMESFTSAVPSSTNAAEIADVSLYDHSKITACVGSCIAEYLRARGIEDYKTALLLNEEAFLNEKAFLMATFDLSGIQNFIYSVEPEDALKSLRSRSFFLEMFTEHCIDMILDAAGLSRANLIYSGGGRCHMLLPNTPAAVSAFENTVFVINRRLIREYETALHLAAAYEPCGGNDLMNRPSHAAPYSRIFRNLSRKLARAKTRKYSAEEIRLLNTPAPAAERECRICGRSIPAAQSAGRCRCCETFATLNRSFFDRDVYVTLREPLPGVPGFRFPDPRGNDVYLYAMDEPRAREEIRNGRALRVYGKNKALTGLGYAAKIHVGDYAYTDRMSELLQGASGIRRIGILRMDADNLGQAFAHGFERRAPNPETRYKYVTLSRSAAFSRQLSLFFKFRINRILSTYKNGENRVSVVYSGGDDVFLLGAWEDVIASALRIQDTFRRYALNRLTLSAGIAVFPVKYPVYKSAGETQELEEKSKSAQGKNSVTLFDASGRHTYDWDTFREKVWNEKVGFLHRCFDDPSVDAGSAALYKILELLQNEDRINVARYAYYLTRLESRLPPRERKTFARTLYGWILVPEERRQAVTALHIYLYQNRNGSEK